MKKALIVGASSGIGRELARQLSTPYTRIGITGRRTELLESLRMENPDVYLSGYLDVTDLQHSPKILEELAIALDGIDLIVISSGTGDLNEGLDFGIEQQTINTNITGFTQLAGWAFNFFAEQGHGHLAVITSIGGLRGSRQAPAYNASKAYQINYLEGLRQKATHQKLRITVTDIRPGLVDTAMAKGDGLFWVAPVNKTASQIAKGLLAEKHVVYVTRRWGILARILMIVPGFLYRRM